MLQPRAVILLTVSKPIPQHICRKNDILNAWIKIKLKKNLKSLSGLEDQSISLRLLQKPYHPQMKKKIPTFSADHSIWYKRQFYNKFEVSLGSSLSKNLCKPPKKFRPSPVNKSLEKQSNNNKKNLHWNFWKRTIRASSRNMLKLTDLPST